MVSELDKCLEVSEFENQFHYYVHFQTNLGKGMKLLIPAAMG